jgi:F-type H+-transporting ATPase subunit epsilon
VSGGFAEVTGKKVTIVAEAAEMGREIDIERARRAMERAEKRLAAAKTESLDWARAEAALRRAIMRMKVAGR